MELLEYRPKFLLTDQRNEFERKFDSYRLSMVDDDLLTKWTIQNKISKDYNMQKNCKHYFKNQENQGYANTNWASLTLYGKARKKC